MKKAAARIGDDGWWVPPGGYSGKEEEPVESLCGERMLGNEDVACQKGAGHDGEHLALLPGEGTYTWYVDRVGLERLRTALLR